MVRQLEREVAQIVHGHRPTHRARGQRDAGSHIQTLLFDRTMFSPTQAEAWALAHGFRIPKLHLTDRYVRIRQAPPQRDKVKRTIDLRPGVRAVVERD